MAKAIISRRGGYATITFNGVYALKKIEVVPLKEPQCYLAATTVGDYALFGGGAGNGYVSRIDAYNTSLTKTVNKSLSVARRDLAATTVGNYALFGG